MLQYEIPVPTLYSYFVKPGIKNGKTVCQQWFLSKLIWFILYIYLAYFFYWGFLFVGKTMQNLYAFWAISSYSFNFIVSLSCVD